jgi:hypothetical protein
MVGPTMVFAKSPSASEPPNPGNQPTTVVINGRTFGPKDGLKIETFQFELQDGSGPVGVVFGDTPNEPGTVTPLDATYWGTSYAISTEDLFLFYTGRAKAAANVYNGKRFVQVCIWYYREGDGIVGAKVCSNATDTGYQWLPGTEVVTTATDTPIPWAPHTIFNISVVQIDPQIY